MEVEDWQAGVAESVLGDAAPALLACAGKRLPDGLHVDCCHTCARRGGAVVVLVGVMEPAAQFVETGRKVGWQCQNRRAG